MNPLRRVLRRLAGPPRFPRVAANTLAVRDLACLKRAFGWASDPLLRGEHLRAYEYPEDLNERRLRDAEALGAACRNADARILVEIGTSFGHGAALMAENAPGGVVHTVNLLPEDAAAGGRMITGAPPREQIGRYYRELGLANVVQIFANTATWEPAMGPIDVAFIDGCHDADFVFNDTRKILSRCHPGSLILWHDFAPELAATYDWIAEVCRGVERLYARGLIRGRIFHLRDSWVGIHRVG